MPYAIDPKWSIIVSIIYEPKNVKIATLSKKQNICWNDVKLCFKVMQLHFQIV
jgi:hypothetical protein